MAKDSVEADEILLRFNRLIRELIQGETGRETFQPWGVELLLDIQDWQVRESARADTLRRYQRAVQRGIERGDTVPMKLSEFLGSKR